MRAKKKIVNIHARIHKNRSQRESLKNFTRIIFNSRHALQVQRCETRQQQKNCILLPRNSPPGRARIGRLVFKIPDDPAVAHEAKRQLARAQFSPALWLSGLQIAITARLIVGLPNAT